MDVENSLIGQNIAAILNAKNLNPSKLAAMMGVSKQNIYQIIKGGDPQISTLIKIAKVLNVPVSQLIGETESKLNIDKKGKSKILLQVEVDTEIEENVLKMVLGKDFMNQIKK